MTKEEILKRVKKFQGANREFSQELPPIIEGLVDLIDEAGPEVVDNLTSNSPTKALSANMGKELKLMVDGKVSEPETAGTAGQILQLDEEGVPEWVDAAEVGATYDSAVSDTSTNAIQNKTIKKYVDDNFAHKDGYYGSLTAGAAENIVGKSAIEGTFLFRTTAGDADISNGVATVEAVKGNTVAWNQLINDSEVAASGSNSGIDYTFANHLFTAVSGTASATSFSDFALGYTKFSIINGHKYYAGKAFAPTNANCLLQVFSDQLNNWSATSGTNSAMIFTAPGDATNVLFRLRVASGTSVSNIKWYQIVIDLTLMGIDNLTTVAQVESWLAANVGSKPYFPASSKLLPTKLLKYVSRGFNQWDEEWESGYYSDADASPMASDQFVRTKNPIPALPSTTYYYKNGSSTNTRYLFLDSNKGLISSSTGTNKEITTPEGCAFILFYWLGTTYNHDICINLSWDGSRNGEYEPYVENEYNIDVTKFYGKLNGEGDLTQIFPNGMRKADYAGTVRDLLSLKDAEADVKVGSVDLGTLVAGNWTKQSTGNFITNAFNSVMKGASANTEKGNLLSNKLANSVWDTAGAKSEMAVSTSSVFFVGASGVDSTSALVTFLQGVMLNYELATPAHYTDLVYRDNGVDTPVEALNVIVNNWSTEEEIIAAPEASGDPNSCAATLDILYGIDAAEQLDTINQSGIFTADLKANLEALIGVINSNCAEALGGTLSISENPTEKVYTFTFTPSTPESQGE